MAQPMHSEAQKGTSPTRRPRPPHRRDPAGSADMTSKVICGDALAVLRGEAGP